MKENLPPGARVFQVNDSGFTGYFSQRPVVNGDGLVNSWEYQKYLRSGRLIDYLRENDIQYIIWDFGGPALKLTIKKDRGLTPRGLRRASLQINN